MRTLTRAGEPPKEQGHKIRQIKPSAGTCGSFNVSNPSIASDSWGRIRQIAMMHSSDGCSQSGKNTFGLKATSEQTERDSDRVVD